MSSQHNLPAMDAVARSMANTAEQTANAASSTAATASSTAAAAADATGGSKLATAQGSVVTSGILVGGTLDIPIVFSRSLVDTNYTVQASVENVPLGVLRVRYPVTAKTTTGCTVTVEATAILAAATVKVTAIVAKLVP